jgi:hypothetical protein
MYPHSSLRRTTGSGAGPGNSPHILLLVPFPRLHDPASQRKQLLSGKLTCNVLPCARRAIIFSLGCIIAESAVIFFLTTELLSLRLMMATAFPVSVVSRTLISGHPAVACASNRHLPNILIRLQSASIEANGLVRHIDVR